MIRAQASYPFTFQLPRVADERERPGESLITFFHAVETMGLEPTTPCLQIRPTRTTANSDDRLRQIRGAIRTPTDACERLRMRHQCAIGIREGFAAVD
jgi:hypothetical protein